MFDINCVTYCELCECVVYRFPCCGRRSCDGGGCDLCWPIHDKVWAWLDEQNVDEEVLRKSGRIVRDSLKDLLDK